MACILTLTMLVFNMMLERQPWDLPDSALAEAVAHYLKATLHTPVDLARLEGIRGLPAFLEQNYHFFAGNVAGRKCIFAVARGGDATPAEIARHIGRVRAETGDIVVFVTAELSAPNRARLIGHGVPFVAPGNQLYIPDLAIDLREHYRAPRQRVPGELTPAAQAVLIHHLLGLDRSATTPSALAKKLKYSAMSIGRAFDNLSALGLARAEKHGKEKRLLFDDNGQRLLENARPFIRSPVRAERFVRSSLQAPQLKHAGETALSELGALSRPRLDTYAIAAVDWKSVVDALSLTETDAIEADFRIETWSYDPVGLSDGPCVDPLSLYAQFWNHRDERIALAAQGLLECVKW